MTTKPSEGKPVSPEEITSERRFDLTPVVHERKEIARRPHKFTLQAKRKILIALRMGHYPEAAARYAGVKRDTLLNWWERGQLAGAESEGVDLELYEFSEDCLQARATPEVGLVAILWRHARNDGKVAIQLLEKLFPDRYGRQTIQKVDGKIVHEVKKVDYSNFTDEELEEMERLAKKARFEKLKEGAIDAEVVR